MLPPIAQVGASSLGVSSGRAPASVRLVTGADEIQRGMAAQALAQRGSLRTGAELERSPQPSPSQRSAAGIGGSLGGAGLGLHHPCTFEVYTWSLPAASFRALDLHVYGVRAVNNARSVAWGAFSGASGGALTTFVDAAGALALGAFDGGAFAWRLLAGPRTGYIGAGFEAYSPTLCVDPTSGHVHLAWLERLPMVPPLELVVVLEAELRDSGAAPGVVLWRTEVQGVALVVGRSLEPAGLKYLAFDRGDGVAHFGCTYYDEAFGDELRDNLAVFLDGPTWSRERSVGAERSSDPSVGTSPDGSTVVTAWEELTVDETVPGGAGRTVSLWVKLVKAGVTYGQWAMTYAGDALQGGDVSVWVSSEWMYVAFQGKDGGIFVYRASHALAAVGTAPTWEPLGTAFSPKFPQAGYLDVGWLPNLVGVGVLGVDYLAVVWERSDRELTYNPEKVAALAFVRSDGSGFVVEGAVITMELSGEAYGTDQRFQMSPAVAIGDPSTLWLLGYLPVDVMWMEVTSGGRLPGPDYILDFTVVLTHRRYAWGGACITSY